MIATILCLVKITIPILDDNQGSQTTNKDMNELQKFLERIFGKIAPKVAEMSEATFAAIQELVGLVALFRLLWITKLQKKTSLTEQVTNAELAEV